MTVAHHINVFSLTDINSRTIQHTKNYWNFQFTIKKRQSYFVLFSKGNKTCRNEKKFAR